MEPWYATREEVQQAVDFKETARTGAAVDRAIAAASRDVDLLCHLRFYPEQATRRFDWPAGARPWRIWLDDSRLISLTSLTSGGTTIDPGDVLLEPNRTGPPYSRIELNTGTGAAFTGGDTSQQNITVTGLWAGAPIVESPAGALDGGITSSQTTIATTAAPDIGVGSLLRIGTERLTVTGRRMASTFVDLAADLPANAAAVTITGVSAGFEPGEVILVDSERMLIVDQAPTSLTVKRAHDGSTLAAHTAGASINALRTLIVRRGVLGSTAAAHDTGTVVERWEPHPLVRQLTVAQALYALYGERSGWTQSGTGSSSGSKGGTRARSSSIPELRDQVYGALGRKARTRAV